MSFNPARKAKLLAATGALALALVPGARPGSIPQLLTLGPLTVLNGTAIVSGTVGGAGVGSQLSVNGHPLSLDAAGNFAGVVSLDGASALDFAVGNRAANSWTSRCRSRLRVQAGSSRRPRSMRSSRQAQRCCSRPADSSAASR